MSDPAKFYLRWHPSSHESLNRYTMLVLHEAALRENAEREIKSQTPAVK